MDSRSICISFANILTIGKIRSMVDHGENDYIKKKYNQFRDLITPDVITYGDFLEYGYRLMAKSYRNEYIYKNQIVNRIIKKHSLKTSVILNEFHIGNSIADLIFLNGTDRAFEIKTEYDSEVRLLSQLSDYRKVFSRVYLVIPQSLLSRYESMLDDSIGIILLTNRNCLKEYKKAIPNYDNLDAETMMKCLRKEEYTDIIRKMSVVPDTTPVKFFQACLEVFRSLPILELHSQFINTLKRRKLHNYAYIENEVPDFLKLLAINLNPDSIQCQGLNNVLTKVISA